uniref:Uncharacterized protein n=1 Tax=Knipowitschia caucasica TaxID=637954 RepID=A0AAV2MQY7_KNICA
MQFSCCNCPPKFLLGHACFHCLTCAHQFPHQALGSSAAALGTGPASSPALHQTDGDSAPGSFCGAVGGPLVRGASGPDAPRLFMALLADRKASLKHLLVFDVRRQTGLHTDTGMWLKLKHHCLRWTPLTAAADLCQHSSSFHTLH